MSSTNRFLTTSEQNHDNATEKTLSDLDNFIQSGNLEVITTPNPSSVQNVQTDGLTDVVQCALDTADQTGNLNIDIAEQSLANVSCNLAQVGGSAISQTAGVQDVSVVSPISVDLGVGSLVDVRHSRVPNYSTATIIMSTEGMSSSDTPTSFGDGLATGELLTIPTSQIAVNGSSIGTNGLGADDGAVIEIIYYPSNVSTTKTTANVTLLAGHGSGQLLPFAWFRIVSLKHISSNMTGLLFVGDNTFSSGKPTVIYSVMTGIDPLTVRVGVSRTGNFYINAVEKLSLTRMTISDGFNAAGSVYRLDCHLRPSADTDFQNLLFSHYIRQGGYFVDWSVVNAFQDSGSFGADLIFTIMRTNSTHNEPVLITLGCVLEDTS